MATPSTGFVSDLDAMRQTVEDSHRLVDGVYLAAAGQLAVSLSAHRGMRLPWMSTPT
jgi:hypothetical protein